MNFRFEMLLMCSTMPISRVWWAMPTVAWKRLGGVTNTARRTRVAQISGKFIF